MNLEELRKKRKVRIEGKICLSLEYGRLANKFLLPSATSGDLKQGVSDYAGQRRILFIFKRATNKFKGDVSLWMQYIDYVKGIRAENLLSGIFAKYVLNFEFIEIKSWANVIYQCTAISSQKDNSVDNGSVLGI